MHAMDCFSEYSLEVYPNTRVARTRKSIIAIQMVRGSFDECYINDPDLAPKPLWIR